MSPPQQSCGALIRSDRHRAPQTGARPDVGATLFRPLCSLSHLFLAYSPGLFPPASSSSRLPGAAAPDQLPLPASGELTPCREKEGGSGDLIEAPGSSSLVVSPAMKRRWGRCLSLVLNADARREASRPLRAGVFWDVWKDLGQTQGVKQRILCRLSNLLMFALTPSRPKSPLAESTSGKTEWT